MEEIFSKINVAVIKPNRNLEIELKFLIDSRKIYPINVKTQNADTTVIIAKKLINKYSNNPCSIQQSVNFINDGKICQLVFIRGVQQKEKEYYEKEKLLTMFLESDISDLLPTYKFDVSYETKIAEFPINSAKLARIRFRYSITIEDWRLDITLTKTINDPINNSANLKNDKTKLLTDIEITDFVDKAPWQFAEAVEFELEYLGDIEKIKEANLSIADDIFEDIYMSMFKSTDSNTSSNRQYQEYIYKIAKYIKPKKADRFKYHSGMKQLGNQVIELNKNSYLNQLSSHITNYYITDKIDGKRAICYIEKDTIKIVSNVLTTIKIDGYKSDYVTILDTEEYLGKYYIFDVMVFHGETLIDLTFEKRLTYFERAAEISDVFKLKEFIRLTDNYRIQLTNFKKEKKQYETDGIVLTPFDGTYTFMKVYKYKPLANLTVDFLIKKCPIKLLSINPYNIIEGKTLYFLFCGIQFNVYRKLALQMVKYIEELFPHIDYKRLPSYFPIQFQPANNNYAYLFYSDNSELDGNIGEFNYINKEWVLHKIREDRKVEVDRGNYFGNNFQIAESIWWSYENPLVIETLKNDIGYFQVNDNKLQKNSRSFNSFVKSNILKEHPDMEWVMDIASGKGQDLFRYNNANYKNVVFLEIDLDAIGELINRKQEFSNNSHGTSMNIQISQLDINEPAETNIAKLSNLQIKKVDLIICNFAFHYFVANKKALNNVIKFINYYLKPGGRFIFTAFDGKAVLSLLNDHEGEYTVKINDSVQYSIKKQYKVNYLEDIGQKIEVMLPFSSSQYYSEYLINSDTISEEFAKHNFVMETDKSFGDWIPEYLVNKNNHLSPADKQYVSLYHYYCFYKKTTGGRRK